MKQPIYIASLLLAASSMFVSCGSSSHHSDAEFVGFHNHLTNTTGFIGTDGRIVTPLAQAGMPGYTVNGMCAFISDDNIVYGDSVFDLYRVDGEGNLTPVLNNLHGCGYLVDDRIPTSRQGGHIVIRDHEGKPVFRLDSVGGLAVKNCSSYYRHGLLPFTLSNGAMAAVNTSGELVALPVYGQSKVREIVIGEDAMALSLSNDTILVADHRGKELYRMPNRYGVIAFSGDTLQCYREYSDEGRIIGYDSFSLSGEMLGSSTFDLDALTKPYDVYSYTIPAMSDYDEEEGYYEHTPAYADSSNLVMHYRYNASMHTDAYFLKKYLQLAEAPFNPAPLIAAWNELERDSVMADSLKAVSVNWFPVYTVSPARKKGESRTDLVATDSDVPAENEAEIPEVVVDATLAATITEQLRPRRIEVQGVQLDGRGSEGIALHNGKIIADPGMRPLTCIANGFMVTTGPGYLSMCAIHSIDQNGKTKRLLDGIYDGGIFNEDVIPVARYDGFQLLDKNMKPVLEVNYIDGRHIAQMARYVVAGKIFVWDKNDNMTIIDKHGNQLSPWIKSKPNYQQMAPNGNYLICEGYSYSRGTPYRVYDESNNIIYKKTFKRGSRYEGAEINLYNDHIAITYCVDNNGEIRAIERYDFDGNQIGPTVRYAIRNEENIPTEDLRDLWAYDTPSAFNQDWVYEMAYHNPSGGFCFLTNYNVPMRARWAYPR